MKKNKILIIFLLLLAIIGCLAAGYSIANRVGNSSKTPNITDYENSVGSEINLAPPSPEEKTANDAKKEEIIGAASDEVNYSLKIVYPIISNWVQNGSNVEISGFVPGIIEEDGKCILELKNNETELTVEKPARGDAQSTICGVITSDKPLKAGTWKASLTYESPNHKGKSDIINIEVK